MAETKELKPKSFRINDETAEKFKEISANIGGNQQETLAKLIEAYEFQQGKAILTEKKSDIEQFEKYVNCLTRMYMSSLEDNQNITETVQIQFEALLKSKDTTIQDLQAQLKEAKVTKEEAVKKASAADEEVNRLNNFIESKEKEFNVKMNDMQDLLKEKENLNKILSDNYNTLKAENSQSKESQEEIKNLSKEVETLKKKVLELEEEKQQIILQNKENILALKEKHMSELEEINKNHITQLNQFQKEYQKHLEKQMQELETNKKKTTRQKKTTTESVTQ